VNLGVPPAPPPEKQPEPSNPNVVIGPNGMPVPIGGIGYRPTVGPAKKKGPPKFLGKQLPEGATPLTIVNFIETKKVFYDPRTKRVVVEHKWGRTELAYDQRMIQVQVIQKRPTVMARFKDMRDELTKDKDKTPKKYLDLADWALTNGLLTECVSVMDELAAQDVKEPAALEVVKAYRQTKAALEKPPARDDAAIVWKQRADCRSVPGKYYTMLYDQDSNKAPSEVLSRLEQLEQNYQQFFYWFALRGKVVAVPERRLVAFTIDAPNDFRNYYSAFDTPLAVTDGFYARRDNLAVFSSVRLDEPSEAIDLQFKELVQNGYNFKSLLKGTYPKGKSLEEASYAQTMALVHKCLEEESEQATTSQEGTRQLLTAVGILPRTVDLPEWAQYGLPSVWATPKYDPFTQTGAFWPTFGTPSWTHQPHFKVLEASKQLDPAEDALRKVLTDRYYRDANDPQALLKARTLSWALSYFLAQKHLDGLLRYGQELSALPRDLELDESVHLACFARAFNLTDPAKPGEPDPAKMRAFANDWYRAISLTTLLMPESLENAQKAWKELRDKEKEKKP
jgi:hypothetical protein